MKELIVGRVLEQSILEERYCSDKAEFVCVYGRRRVGKTFLIRELFEDRIAFYHTAISPQRLRNSPELLYSIQLKEFASTLQKYGDKNNEIPKDWFEAFDRLETLLSSKRTKKKLVVFIDELPWLDTPRSCFMEAFEHFWNGWGAGNHKLMLIVCGSATTWMLDHIVNNNAGLYGRSSCNIRISPFSLGETELFFHKKSIGFDRYDITQAYMIFGGVPYYLDYFRKGISLAQNVDFLLFRDKDNLQNEYENLFSSTFAQNANYKKVVEFLSTKRYGASRQDIAKGINISTGGTLSNILRSLESSDIIMSFTDFGESSRSKYYKLTDMFCLFYLNFICKHDTNNETYWQDNQNSPTLNAWRGLAFENVCFAHRYEIKKALQIGGVQTEIFPWKTDKTDNSDGAQIDMIIDRKDRIINICEIKFCQSDFMLTKDYDEKLRERLDIVATKVRNKKNLQMTLITTYGLKNSMYNGRFQHIIILDNLFYI